MTGDNKVMFFLITCVFLCICFSVPTLQLKILKYLTENSIVYAVYNVYHMADGTTCRLQVKQVN